MESAINPGITGENAIMSRLEQLEKEIEDLKAFEFLRHRRVDAAIDDER